MKYAFFIGEDLISPMGNAKISVFAGFKFMNSFLNCSNIEAHKTKLLHLSILICLWVKLN